MSCQLSAFLFQSTKTAVSSSGYTDEILDVLTQVNHLGRLNLLIVILLLLYLQFRSWKQSVVVLLNLPLALIGGVLALVVTGGVVSIPAIIGFISLFGMATRGGMLLVDRYNELARHGLSRREVVLRGSLDRLLPILMTALSSGLALIPLALGSSLPGNEIQSPMAQVMLGGLLTSTLLNLIIVPLMAPLKVKETGD